MGDASVPTLLHTTPAPTRKMAVFDCLRLHARTFCDIILGTPFGRQNRPDEPEEGNEDPDDTQRDVSLPKREQAHGEE